jgi:branched-chain amino acid aminotransferase
MLEQTYDDRDGWIWMDGRWLAWRDANVHVLSHGLHYASAVFEGTRAYDGKVFKCEEHTARLFKSAEALNLTIAHSQDEINRVTREVLVKNNLQDAYIRPLAWRGPEQMGLAGYKAQTHIMVAAWHWPSYYSPEQHARGLRLCMADWRRASADSAPISAKATALYAVGTLAKQAADKQGYDDAVMLDHLGQVAEATAANIFFVQGSDLIAPISASFLNGITRQTVIALAQRRGIPVIERAVRPDEMGGFDGSFLTGTAAEVAPVGQIAEHHYGIGEMIKLLADDYRSEVRR